MIKKDNDESKSQKPEKSLIELLKEDPEKVEQDEVKGGQETSKLKGASTALLKDKNAKEPIAKKVIANLRADLV